MYALYSTKKKKTPIYLITNATPKLIALYLQWVEILCQHYHAEMKKDQN